MALIDSQKSRDYLSESSHLYNIWRGYRLGSAFIGNCAIIPAMIDYEMRYDFANRRYDTCSENTDVPIILRCLVMTMSIISIILLVPYRYYYRKWYRHIPLTYSQLPTMKKLSLTQILAIRKKPGILEYLGGDTISSIILNLISPYPWLDLQFHFNQERNNVDESVCYYISEIFYAVMYVRFVILALAVFNYGKFRDSFAWRYCEKYRVPSSATFSLKCYTNERPFEIVFGLMVIPSVLIFGAIIRIFERPMRDPNLDFEYPGNSYWNAIVVMTTVGYGDIYPITIFGRIANAFCAFCGGIILPMAFVTVGKVLQLKDNEQIASRSIRLSSEAAQCIIAALQYNAFLSSDKVIRRSISKISDAINNPLYIKLRKRIATFRRIRMSIPADSANVVQIYEKMKNNLHSLEKSFNNLNDSVNSLISSKKL
jgi:Ion channel